MMVTEIISACFGVPRPQVWVALYEKHGEKALIPKPKGVSADPALRIKVVKAVIEQHMSLNQAAAHFMLADRAASTIARKSKYHHRRFTDSRIDKSYLQSGQVYITG